MVRTIDGDARRAALAEAVWRLIARDGLDGASVRGVAVEAGLSTGSVRHFFGSQAELHAFAMEALSDRVRRRIAVAARIPDVRARILAMLTELLPVTERTRVEFAVWLQFMARAAVDPELAAVADRHFGEIRSFVVEVVGLQVEAGLVAPGTDVEAEGVELTAVLDGLTLELLLAPGVMTPESALRVLRARLHVDARTAPA